MSMQPIEWTGAGVILLIVLLLIIRKRLLKPTAIIIGLFISIYTAYLGGIGSFIAIILFFLIGEFVTRVIRNKYYRKPHAIRSTVNIIGNIGPALIALMVNPVSFNVMFFASLSAAFADTLSSEIGVLSKYKPLSIITLQPVETGTDGGVSLLGLMGALGGSIIFGLLAFILTQNIFWGIIILLAGMMGSIFDSFLGATLQKKGVLDNNSTNFVSAFVIGLFFALAF
ncbi:MAG: DUF92 domain-containing protein [Candidatus Diapherotrites archaeon]